LAANHERERGNQNVLRHSVVPLELTFLTWLRIGFDHGSGSAIRVRCLTGREDESRRKECAKARALSARPKLVRLPHSGICQFVTNPERGRSGEIHVDLAPPSPLESGPENTNKNALFGVSTSYSHPSTRWTCLHNWICYRLSPAHKIVSATSKRICECTLEDSSTNSCTITSGEKLSRLQRKLGNLHRF
jgi:hypothetical protein